MNPGTDLKQIQEALLKGSYTMVDLVQHYLDQIHKSEYLNIYVEVFAAEALVNAKRLDERISKADRKPGLLYGAVISIKDVLCYKDHKVSAASHMLKDFTAQYTATAIQRLLDEDALIIGRTNCDEFAMGSTNEHSTYGPTLNGLDPDRVPGGSSGAAAVSVQQGTCLVGIGSDTGGSVRQPAAFCGVFGFKPTYGRISRYGLIAYGSSFDQIGIIGSGVRDISLILSVMAGKDSMDATSLAIPAPKPVRKSDNQQYKFAYIPEMLDHDGLNPAIREEMKAFMQELTDIGHSCTPVSFDLLDYLVPAYYVLTTAEASSNLSRYDGIKYGHRTNEFDNLEDLYERTRTEGFGTEVKRRIMMGTFVLSVGYFDAYFTKAQQVRTLILDRLANIFADYDFLLMPTSTDVAGKRDSLINDPVAMYLSDIYTVLANLGGYPAISIPRSIPGLNLPIGLQIMSDKYEEEALLSLCLSL